jgi:hypothetical protein
MMFRLRESPSSVVRPRVTPDPQHAAELARKISELAYSPENGFHRDQRQVRRAQPHLTLVPK